MYDPVVSIANHLLDLYKKHSSTIDFIDDKRPYGAMESWIDNRGPRPLESSQRFLGYARSLETTTGR